MFPVLAEVFVIDCQSNMGLLGWKSYVFKRKQKRIYERNWETVIELKVPMYLQSHLDYVPKQPYTFN